MFSTRKYLFLIFGCAAANLAEFVPVRDDFHRFSAEFKKLILGLPGVVLVRPTLPPPMRKVTVIPKFTKAAQPMATDSTLIFWVLGGGGIPRAMLAEL